MFTTLSSCAAVNDTKQGVNNADNPLPFTRWTIEEKGDKLISTMAIEMSFTVNRPVREVWPVFKDFNQWHKDLQYTDNDGNEVAEGDAEGQTVYVGVRPSGLFEKYLPASWGRDFLNTRKGIRVLKVFPEKLMVTDATYGGTIGSYYIFALHEENKKTKINISMIFSPQEVSKGDREKLIKANEDLRFNSDGRWNDLYIPTLKALVEGKK